MTSTDSLEWFKDLKIDEFEEFKLDFAVAIDRAIALEGMSKKEVAEKLGVSPSRITNILRGDANLTMEVMHKLAQSVNQKIHICLAPTNANVRTLISMPGLGQTLNVPNTKVTNSVRSPYIPLGEAA